MCNAGGSGRLCGVLCARVFEVIRGNVLIVNGTASKLKFAICHAVVGRVVLGFMWSVRKRDFANLSTLPLMKLLTIISVSVVYVDKVLLGCFVFLSFFELAV